MAKINPEDRLLDDIQDWVRMYKLRAEKNEERYGILYQLIRDFADFSREYLGYFDEIIKNKSFDQDETTSDHLAYGALQRILEEWAAISRLVEQRELHRYETWLTEADSQSRKYLPPGVPGVVTYLGKANAIRHNLYSAVSVTSIPRDQYGSQDWMAGAHEIGHQVFWNLENLEALPGRHKELGEEVIKISENVADAQGLTPEQSQYLANLIVSWLQEIFADVYGTLVAGDEFPKSIIGILRGQIGRRKDLLVNDGDHPLPYLRPLMRIKVLELRGHDTSALCDEWKRTVASLPGDIHINGDLQVELPTASGRLEAHAQPPVETAKVPLVAVETALYKVVEVLLPIAERAKQTGIYYPAQGTSTFKTLKAHIERQAQEQGTEAYKLLLRPLSAISAETEHAHDLYGYHYDPYSNTWSLVYHLFMWHSH